MLKQVAEGVWVHQSEFCQSNAVAVQGQDGVLLIDPGLRSSEMGQLAGDLHELGQAVVAGFSTHPHWDHLLWDARFGPIPRYGTAANAAAVQNVLSNPHWKDFVGGMLPPDIADQIPLDDLFGRITGLAAEAARVPWDGPQVRIIEHRAHAPGHAALLVEERGVLVAGDMLSDVLMPMLDLNAADPIEDYLAALQLFENVVSDVSVLIPGHGTVGRTDQVRARIEQDRAYLQAVRGGSVPGDPRVGPSAAYDWVPGVHERQLQQLAGRRERGGASE
jgi:glyoxylase-like metal-dependent hydrolase (beta-lactamase superfamily II)